MACNSSGGKGGSAAKGGSATKGGGKIDLKPKQGAASEILANRNIKISHSDLINPSDVSETMNTIANFAEEFNLSGFEIAFNNKKDILGRPASASNVMNISVFSIKDGEARSPRQREDGKIIRPDIIRYPGKQGLLRTVLVHELGHTLDAGSGKKYSKRLLGDKESLTMEVSGGVKVFNDKSSKTSLSVAGYISTYAMKNKSEAVAEAFTLKNHPDFERLPQKTKNAVNKVWGDWKPGEKIEPKAYVRAIDSRE